MKKASGYHEDFAREAEVEPGSIRSLVVVMTAVAVIIAVIFREQTWSLILWGVAALLVLLGWLVPAALKPLNRAWFAFGMLLGRVVAPIAMGVVFFGVVMPIGLVRRLLGKDSLSLKTRPEAASYWVERDPPGPEPEHLKRQF